jgi:hypothetical protein
MTAPRSLDEARRDGWDEPDGLTCEYAGHEWRAAGGGLEICTLCEDERWADDEPPVEVVSQRVRERYRSVA